MKFVLLTCASASETWSDEAFVLYTKKISPFIGFEIKELKIKKSSREDREQKLKSDSDLLLSEIKPDDYVVLFDERGESLDSKNSPIRSVRFCFPVKSGLSSSSAELMEWMTAFALARN